MVTQQLGPGGAAGELLDHTVRPCVWVVQLLFVAMSKDSGVHPHMITDLVQLSMNSFIIQLFLTLLLLGSGLAHLLVGSLQSLMELNCMPR